MSHSPHPFSIQSCLAFFGFCCLLTLQGCATRPPKEIEVVSASEVIDLLKTEISKVHIKSQKVTGSDYVCGNKSHEVIVSAVPASATVVLKAVTTDAKSATGGGTFPMLGVQIGPGYTYTDTRAVTQIVTYDFNIAHTPLIESDLTDEIKSYRGKLEVATNALADAQTGFFLAPSLKEFLSEQIREYRATIYSDEETLVELQQRNKKSIDVQERAQDQPVPENKAPVVRSATIKEGASLASAIETASTELVKVNHSALPCLKPQDFKVEFDFDVQRKKDGTLSLTVLVWKVGVERATTSEAFHSVLVTFDTTQGTSTTTLIAM